MKQPRYGCIWIFVALAVFVAAGCEPNNKTISTTSPMSQEIYIEVGESPQALISRYGSAIDVNDKNFGLKFYSLDWPKSRPGRVTIKSGSSAFSIDVALMASGTYDDAFPEEGFSIYDISAGLSIPEVMSHDEARVKFYDMLNRIGSAGWMRWTFPDEPRLAGAEAFRYQLETGTPVGSLDADYLPNLDAWMKLRNQTSWRFYKDGVYMDVQMARDRDRMQITAPGAYFVSISLESYVSRWRTAFAEHERTTWRDRLPGLLASMQADREAAEKRLTAEGYRIDTAYTNPDESQRVLDSALPHGNSGSPQVHPPSASPSLKERVGRWFSGG